MSEMPAAIGELNMYVRSVKDLIDPSHGIGYADIEEPAKEVVDAINHAREHGPADEAGLRGHLTQSFDVVRHKYIDEKGTKGKELGEANMKLRSHLQKHFGCDPEILPGALHPYPAKSDDEQNLAAELINKAGGSGHQGMNPDNRNALIPMMRDQNTKYLAQMRSAFRRRVPEEVANSLGTIVPRIIAERAMNPALRRKPGGGPSKDAGRSI